MDWRGVDYCVAFISCLVSPSDGTHSLQRILCWASDISSNLFWWRNISTSWTAWGSVNFLSFFISGWTIHFRITTGKVLMLTIIKKCMCKFIWSAHLFELYSVGCRWTTSQWWPWCTPSMTVCSDWPNLMPWRTKRRWILNIILFDWNG